DHGVPELLDDLLDEACAARSGQGHSTKPFIQSWDVWQGSRMRTEQHDIDTVPTTGARDRVPTVAGGALLAIAVVLTALNLRPAVTSVSTLLGDMRTDLSVSAT